MAVKLKKMRRKLEKHFLVKLEPVVPVKCPYCGADSSYIVFSNKVFGLSRFGTINLEAIPVVTATCTRCGHIMLFDARKLKITT